MTDPKELIKEMGLAITAEYAEDLGLARLIMADVSLYFAMRPALDDECLRLRVDTFLLDMAQKEALDLE